MNIHERLTLLLLSAMVGAIEDDNYDCRQRRECQTKMSNLSVEDPVDISILRAYCFWYQETKKMQLGC